MFSGRLIIRWFVRVGCVMAIMSVRFGHQLDPALAVPHSAIQTAEFAWLGGSFPSFCVSKKEIDGNHSIGMSQYREASRIDPSFLWPAPLDQSGIRLAFSRYLVPPSDRLPYPFVPLKSRPRAPPRLPPLV